MRWCLRRSVEPGLSAACAGRFPYETPERAHLDFWELLECLTEQPPPTLPSAPPGGGSLSAAYRAFVDACLQKDPGALRRVMQDTVVAAKINRLIAAGVLSVR